jgi:hypothetical protein
LFVDYDLSAQCEAADDVAGGKGEHVGDSAGVVCKGEARGVDVGQVFVGGDEYLAVEESSFGENERVVVLGGRKDVLREGASQNFRSDRLVAAILPTQPPDFSNK